MKSLLLDSQFAATPVGMVIENFVVQPTINVKVRQCTNIHCDLMIAGKSTLAFCVIKEEDILFHHFRSKVTQKIEDLQRRFKIFKLFFYLETEYGLEALCKWNIEMENMPPLFIVNDVSDIYRILVLSETVYSKDHEEKRREHVSLMRESCVSRSSVENILSNIPGVASQNQDRILLLDCFATLSNISQATAMDILHHTPCTQQTAFSCEAFFSSMGE